MIRSPRSVWVVAVALLVAWPLAGDARADDEQEARALFQRAEASFRDGRFEDALKDYQSAYQAKPLPGFLFNIGQCYRRVGLYEPARVFFRRFIALDPPVAQRQMAEELIGDLDQLEAQQRRISELKSAETPSGAVAVAAVPEHQSAAHEMLLLTAADREASPPIHLAVREPAPVVAQPRRAFYRRWWFWTLVGGAVAGGVAAAVIVGGRDGHPGSLPPIDATGAGP